MGNESPSPPPTQRSVNRLIVDLIQSSSGQEAGPDRGILGNEVFHKVQKDPTQKLLLVPLVPLDQGARTFRTFSK